MAKKILPLFVLIALAACFLSYKFGSAPVARAESPLALPAPPATWTVSAAAAPLNSELSATKPAGGAGVQHVATCVIVNVENIGTSTSQNTVSLWDGTYNSGNRLLIWDLSMLPGTSNSVSLCDLNVVGTANTPMTVSSAPSAVGQNATVNLVGYDAQ